MSEVPAKNNQFTGFEVDMGQEVSMYSADKYKASEARKDLITILSTKPIVTRTMYTDEVGFRFHYLQEAAERGVQTDVHYNFIIAVWNSAADGKKLLDKTYKLAVLSVARRVYKRLVSKHEIHGALNKIILQVTCEDEKFQSIQFEVMNQKPPFVEDKELMQEIKESYQNVRYDLMPIVAGMLTPEEFLEKWNEARGTSGGGSDKGSQTQQQKQVSEKEVNQQVEDISFEEVGEEPEKKAVESKKKEEPKQEKKEPEKKTEPAKKEPEKKTEEPKQETKASGEDKADDWFAEEGDFSFD